MPKLNAGLYADVVGTVVPEIIVAFSPFAQPDVAVVVIVVFVSVIVFVAYVGGVAVLEPAVKLTAVSSSLEFGGNRI
jgi:hypothetical protein